MIKGIPLSDFELFYGFLPGPHIVFAADDPTFTILYQNKAHAKLTMNNPKQAIGRPCFEVFPDNSGRFKQTGYSELAESFRRVIKLGKADSLPTMRYDITDKRGAILERWWRVTHYPVRDREGDIVAIYQSTEDITRQIETAKQLELTNLQLQSALAIGLVSTWYWDIPRDRVYGDKNLADRFGVSYKDVVKGLPLQIFVNAIHAEDRTRVAKAIEHTVKHRGVFEIEYRTLNGKGGISWVIARGSITDNAKGEPERFSGVLIDITARRAAQAENAELKALSVAKDEFVALASHQLRTPATVVKQYLNMLIDGYVGPISTEQRQYLLIANEANDRQLNIVNDLLKTAQIDTKGFTLQLQKTNIHEYLERLIKPLADDLALRNQKLDFTPSHELISATIDRQEIRICLNNLIENASKYSAEGQTISLTTKKLRNSFQIHVIDHGVGIAEADQQHIFDKFTRISNPLSDTVAGNGLGLYWVKRIINLHHGKLRIKSQLGKGTRFTIELPYEQPQNTKQKR